MPADSLDAACLLHRNTRVAAQWQWKLNMHSSLHTCFWESDSSKMGHMLTDTHFAQNRWLHPCVSLYYLRSIGKSFLNFCWIHESLSCDNKQVSSANSFRREDTTIFKWSWCVMSAGMQPGCVDSRVYSNPSEAWRQVTNTATDFIDMCHLFFCTCDDFTFFPKNFPCSHSQRQDCHMSLYIHQLLCIAGCGLGLCSL